MAIAYSWVPDTCPWARPCEFDIETGRAIRLCATHQDQRLAGKRDDEICEIVRAENREASRTRVLEAANDTARERT